MLSLVFATLRSEPEACWWGLSSLVDRLIASLPGARDNFFLGLRTTGSDLSDDLR